MRRAACALLLAACCGTAAAAQSVTLTGTLGTKALLVIDGQPPRALGAGESAHGVRLVSLQGEVATIESAGQRRTLRLGEAPVQVGASTIASPGARRMVLVADGAGHFMPAGSINGKPVQFMVDTGATVVGIGKPEAERIGIDLKAARPVRMSTANGMAQGWQVRLASVRVGEMELREIDAVVMPQAMPYVLLGNSFLTQVNMTRTNDQLVLERRF